MNVEIDKDKYTAAMASNLSMLRAKLGLTQDELCQLAGISRQTVVQAEKVGKLSWGTYLSLVLIFSKNKEAADLMEFLGIYPKELDEYANKKELEHDGMEV